jgi:double-stranded uracil-DNA glycosylase
MPSRTASAAAPLLRGLQPIFDPGVRVLILGSFPSPASLAAQRYYAHPQNQFWRLLGGSLAVDLGDLDYALRVTQILAQGVGVWDVYRDCRRAGALDSAIRDAVRNDFPTLLAQAPQLGSVLFNGQEAGRAAPHFARLGFTTATLPSSSPAYTLSYPEKLQRWQSALAEALLRV